MRFCLLALWLTASLTAGCVRKPLEAMPVGSGPSLDPMTFFHGRTHSGGVIESRSGAPTEWIVTDSHGVKDGAGRLRMVQHLSFQDGTAQVSHLVDVAQWPQPVHRDGERHDRFSDRRSERACFPLAVGAGKGTRQCAHERRNGTMDVSNGG